MPSRQHIHNIDDLQVGQHGYLESFNC